MMNPSSPDAKPLNVLRAILIFVALFVVAIPWWWQFAPQVGNRLMFGAPTWFVTSIVGSCLVSLVTARYLLVAWAALDLEEDDEVG